MIPKHAQQLLDEIEGSKLKGKEVKFIKDVKFFIAQDWRLTPRMSDWLQAIYRSTQDNRGYQNRE